MKHMTKRALAMLLVLVTVLAVFPVMTSTAVAEEAEPVFTQEDYDALYVQNGLTMLMTAYTAEETAAIIEAGTWANKATAEGYATLAATLQNGTRTAWAAADKGIYFRFDEAADYADKANTGIMFPAMALSANADALTDGDFAVELVFEPTFVSTDNGDGTYTIIPQDNIYDGNGVIQGTYGSRNKNYGNTYGAYTSGRSAFAIAGLQMCFFMPSVLYEADNAAAANPRYIGSSAQMRSFYYKLPQGSATGLSGSYYSATTPFGTYGYNRKPLGGNLDADRVLQDGMVIDSYTLSVNRTLEPAGAAYVPTVFDAVLGSTSFTVNNGDGSALSTGNSDVHKGYWTLEQLGEAQPSYSPFEAFYGLPATVYAARAYNRTLATEERWQNHFADLASYFEIDLTVFNTLTADQKLGVYELLASMTFRRGSKELVENAIVAARGAEKSVYDELYVENGLVMLVSAYEGTEAGFVTENGKIVGWTNKAPDATANATLVSTTNPWTLRKGGGIGYDVRLEGGVKYRQRTNVTVEKVETVTETVEDQEIVTTTTTTTVYPTYRDQYSNGKLPGYDSVSTTVVVAVNGVAGEATPSDAHLVPDTEGCTTTVEKTSNPYVYAKNETGSTITSYLDLGVGLVDTTGNYTVEYAAKLMVINTKDAPDVRSTTPHGDTFTTDRCTVKLGAFGAWLYVSGNTYNYRRLYNTQHMNTHWGHGVGWSGDYTSPWSADAITVSSHVVTNGDNYAKQTLYANGGANSNVFEPVGVADAQKNVMTHITSAVNAFYVLRNVANTTYAARVYNRALEKSEVAWNYAVDLMAYYKIDVTGVDLLTQTEKDALAANLSRFKLEEDGARREIQAYVSNAVAKVVATAAAENAYDKLYVQEDLAALFTAFDPVGSGIDLASGKWADKKTGVTVSLEDNSSVAAWSIGEGGRGVSYRFDSLMDLAADRYNIGMRLPTGVLTNGDISVEYTYKVNPVENADGTQARILNLGTTNTKPIQTNIGVYNYGLYNGNRSSFTFGGLQLCQFQWDNYQGASMTSRIFYTYTGWDGTNGTTFIQPYLFGSAENGFSYGVSGIAFTRKVTDRSAEETYHLAEFGIFKNGKSQGTIQNGTGLANSKNFYTIDELNSKHSGSTAADAFFGVPATVYAIRLYTDDLTTEELKQNHAVDLMAYFELDVRGFAAADEAKKTAVYDAFASYTFNDADKVEEMQALIDAAVAGIPVAEGVQVGTDGSSLRIWASMDTDENVSKLGMRVTFKNGDEVVSENSGTTQVAFESITSGGNTVTADELRAEYLYAAIVKGIPAGTYTVEVTPYVIMMDETTVTGETKSMDLTFN